MVPSIRLRSRKHRENRYLMKSIPQAANTAGMNAHGLRNPTKAIAPKTSDKH